MAQSTDAYVRSSAVIAGGEAISNAVDISKLQLLGVAVIVPSAWTGADIGFEVSVDGSVWVPLYDDTGARVKISGVATNTSRVYIAPAEVWAAGAFPYLRLVSLNTSTGANINQGGVRSLMLIRLAT